LKKCIEKYYGDAVRVLNKYAFSDSMPGIIEEPGTHT
jgi:hypothetical protein